MRRLLLAAILVLPLVACQRDEQPVEEPATAQPEATTAAAEPEAPEAPAEAAAPLPVGQCGDQSGVPEADRLANTARWSTASELENFGYDVYRGDAEEGPFERLTSDPIQGAGTSDEPSKYSFKDDTIDPCKSYWYYVESISTSGTREKFTPVFHAPAKRRAAD